MNDSNGEGKAEYSDDFDSSDDDGKIEWINYLHVHHLLVVSESLIAWNWSYDGLRTFIA